MCAQVVMKFKAIEELVEVLTFIFFVAFLVTKAPLIFSLACLISFKLMLNNAIILATFVSTLENATCNRLKSCSNPCMTVDRSSTSYNRYSSQKSCKRHVTQNYSLSHKAIATQVERII